MQRNTRWIGLYTAVLCLAGIVPTYADIAFINPVEGTIGTLITINGSGFGDKRGKVQLGTEGCQILSWGDSIITCEVVTPQPAGDYTVTLSPQGSNQGNKKVLQPMTFSAFTIREPEITLGELTRDDDTVTITGAFFGDKKGTIRLAYREGEVVVESGKVVDWSMDAIRFKLPDGLPGNFILKVQNDVGTDYALFDLGDGPPILKLMPEPQGYGNQQAYVNARGIYYNGQLYVFSICYDKIRSYWWDKQWLIEYRTFKDHQLSSSHSLWGGTSYAEPIPLVVKYPDGQEKMFVFVSGRNGYIYFTRLNGGVWEDGDWLKIKTTSNEYPIVDQDWVVAPVYNPATHRLEVYYGKDSKSNYLYHVYSYDFGDTWTKGGRVHMAGSSDTYPGTITSAPSAVYYIPPDGASDTILAVKDSGGHLNVWYLMNGDVVSQSHVETGDIDGQGAPFLTDLGSDSIALMWGEQNTPTGIYEEPYVPHIRKLTKATGEWGDKYQPLSLPDIFGIGREYGFAWQSSGAINYEPNSSGGYDRIFYLFFGYDLKVWGDGDPGPWWMFTAIENLGP
jgi:hypothetical protein